jgi:hypothetical protein
MRKHAPRRKPRPQQPRHATGHGGGSVDLEGRTDATFGPPSFTTHHERLSRGTGCDACPPNDCIHMTGMLRTSYTTSTVVTLPTVDQNLSACQRVRVQSAIRNVLAPHEQQHVRAFNTYSGVTNRPFQLTACRDAIEAERDTLTQQMVDDEDTERQDKARAKSAALDPFVAHVDLDCTDAPARRGTRRP